MDLPIITDSNIFTPKEVLDKIIPNDTSFEMTGFVKSIKKVRSFTRNGHNGNLFNFVLDNGEETVQVTAWNDLALQYSEKIPTLDLVVCLQNILTKIPAKPEYVQASCPFELVIRKSTIMEIIGIYKPTKKLMKDVPTVPIKNVKNYDGKFISVCGYITVPFNKVNGQFYIGAITDGYFKLNIIVTNDGDLLDDPNLGEKVIVSGKMTIPIDKKAPFVSVPSTKNMHLIPKDKMFARNFFLGYHPIV